MGRSDAAPLGRKLPQLDQEMRQLLHDAGRMSAFVQDPAGGGERDVRGAAAALRGADAQERRLGNHGGVGDVTAQAPRQSAVDAAELLVHNGLEDQVSGEPHRPGLRAPRHRVDVARENQRPAFSGAHPARADVRPAGIVPASRINGVRVEAGHGVEFIAVRRPTGGAQDRGDVLLTGAFLAGRRRVLGTLSHEIADQRNKPLTAGVDVIGQALLQVGMHFNWPP